MAITIDRTTKEISTKDTTAAMADANLLVYHKRMPPKEVYAAPPWYRVIEGNDVRVATEQEQVVIDAQRQAQAVAEAKSRHNTVIEQAKAIIDSPQTADHFVSLAMAEITRQSIQAVRKAIRDKTNPTADVDLAALKESAKQVLDSLKVK